VVARLVQRVSQAECHLVAAELREGELRQRINRAHCEQAQVRDALAELQRVERWVRQIRRHLELLHARERTDA
jgi:uncharacterized protein involved in exopolysaccharide biosynthesis